MLKEWMYAIGKDKIFTGRKFEEAGFYLYFLRATSGLKHVKRLDDIVQP